MNQKAFPLWRLIGCFGLVLVGLLCLACLGFVAPLAIVFELLFGWVLFLVRTVPKVPFNAASVLTGLVCLLGLVAGLHLFLRRITKEPSRWSMRSSLIIVGLVVLTFAAGIAAVGLTHQITWLATSPEPLYGATSRLISARMQSRNNLGLIGVAVHNYSDAHKHLPAGAVFDKQGRAMHGWQTMLLPFIQQDQLYREINLELPWNHPDNARAFARVVPGYLHPAAEPKTAGGFALSHYSGNAHVLGGDEPVSFLQIQAAAGMSQTILAGEAAGAFQPWGHPHNWRDPRRGLNQGRDGFGNPAHPDQPTQLLFADGSVRSFAADTDPEFLALLSRPQPRK